MLSKTRIGARGALAYLEPRFVPWVFRMMQALSPTYLRLAEGVRRVRLEGIERLIDAYRDFYAGRSRLLLAFRHPTAHDPQVMVYLITRALPAAARARKEPLGGLPHVHFVYGRNVVLWHGGGAGFLIPRIEGVPVMNRRSDSQGVRALRHYLVDGPYPMALAPEGQVTYHNHCLGPVEPGTAHLALWCREELRRRGDAREVRILPIAPLYRYAGERDRVLQGLTGRLAAQTGIAAPAEGGWREHLLELTGALLDKVEATYGRFHPLAAAAAAPPAPAASAAPAGLRERIERVCDAALRVAESFMGLPAEGDLLTRVFTVRQRGWDYLFREDLADRRAAAPLDRALADRLADCAYLMLRHHELADVLEYVRPDYLDSPTPNRLIEYALNLLDVVNRLNGGDIGGRHSPRGKQVLIRIGEPLVVGEEAGPRRERVERLTANIVERLEQLSAE